MKWTIIIIALMLIPLIQVPVSAEHQYIIDGNTVYIDDSNVYMSANPHTLGSSGWVTLELKVKTTSLDVDLAFGFNVTNCQPTRLQIWTNYSHPVETFIPYNRMIQIPVGDHWEWTNTTIYNVTYVNVSYEDWKDVNTNFDVYNFEYQGMNKWYVKTHFPVVKDQLYKCRIWVQIPFSGLNNSVGEYFFAVKPSSLTLSQAVQQGYFYYLDPWWNTAWKKRVLVSIDNAFISATLTGFPIGIPINASLKENCSYADGKDIRFIGSDNVTEYPYELENWTSANPIAWVNFTKVYSDADTGFYIYMNNSGATDNQSSTLVWDNNFQAVWHCNDSTVMWDSSANHWAVSALINTRPGLIAGKIGYGIDFVHGPGGYNFGNILPIGTNLFTFEMWFNSSGFRAQSDIVIQKYDPGVDGYEVVGESTANREIWSALADGGNFATGMYGVDTGVDNSLWHPYWLRRPVVTTTTAYMNDTWWLTASNGAVNDITTTVNFVIGNWPGTAYNWNGVLDEMRLSYVARNDSWVNATSENFNATGFFIFGPIENYVPPSWRTITVGYMFNATTNVCPCCINLGVNVTDSMGQKMNVTFYFFEENTTGNWIRMETKYGVYNGSVFICINNVSILYNTTYRWYANVTNITSDYNLTDVYYFVTSTYPCNVSGSSTSSEAIVSDETGIVGIVGIIGILGFIMVLRRKKE